MSDGDFGSEYASSGNKTPRHAYAVAFLTFVPGIVLLLLGREHSVFLPKRLLEFIFPFTVLPLEKLAIVRFGLGGITVEDFGRVDLFTQQFFVLSFCFFFLVLIILTASAAKSELLIEKPSSIAYLLMILLSFLLRDFQIYVLVTDVASIRFHDPSAFLMLGLARVIAPEMLIFVNCMMACFVWGLMYVFFRFVYDRSS